MLARLVRGLHREDAGFTLIELMIVIAVIMILAAIILPQFAIARERAKKAACISNQRDLETAVSMWATDNPMPVYVGGTMNASSPSFAQITPQYTLAATFLEPDHGTGPDGSDYYLSNGSASGAAASAQPAAPSYGHVTCAYQGASDPWVAGYNTPNAGAPSINHTRGAAASP